MDNVAVVVAQYLELDVMRFFHELLQIDRVVSKGGHGLGACRVEVSRTDTSVFIRVVIRFFHLARGETLFDEHEHLLHGGHLIVFSFHFVGLYYKLKGSDR